MDDRDRGTRDASNGRDRPRGADPEGTSQHHDSQRHQDVGRGHAQHQDANQGHDSAGGRGGQREGRERRQTDTRELGENEHMRRQYGEGSGRSDDRRPSGESGRQNRYGTGYQRGSRGHTDRSESNRRHDVGQNQGRSRHGDEGDVHSLSQHGGRGGQHGDRRERGRE